MTNSIYQGPSKPCKNKGFTNQNQFLLLIGKTQVFDGPCGAPGTKLETYGTKMDWSNGPLRPFGVRITPILLNIG